jgi:hypothetical protein
MCFYLVVDSVISPIAGRTNNRRLKEGRRHVGYLRATKDKTAERKRIASKSPEKQQKALHLVHSLEGVAAFKLFPSRRVFQSPKKGHSMLHLYSSST